MRIQLLLLASLLGSCSVSTPMPYGPPQAVPEELAGRVAGAPQRCVPIMPGSQLRPSGDSLAYQVGNTLWINRPLSACHFRGDEVILTQSIGGMGYCDRDLVRSVDSSGSMPGPSCTLGPWIPYTLAP